MNDENLIAKPDKLTDNFVRFYKQMDNESDRGAIIVSVSLLDELLTDMIKAKLAPSLETRDELFDTAYCPFSSFSAKTDLAYRLGLIRPSIRKSFHLLRRIRNNFAHATNIKGFDSPSTQDRIKELLRLNHVLIKTLTQLLKDEVPAIETTNDLIKNLGWRKTLQLLFASLACALPETIEDIGSIVAPCDITEEE
ncbi:MAG: hypothetical protein MI749_16005 [Desulfovibrionales bacterium]|nr:hypothetical protein [Desulfovibrionales bacterium]